MELKETMNTYDNIKTFESVKLTGKSTYTVKPELYYCSFGM